MRIYLDNNIIVNIETGNTTVQNLKNWLPETNIEFYYSSAHIQEAINKKEPSEKAKTEFLAKRFNLITEITDNNYVDYEPSLPGISFSKVSPQIVLSAITEIPVSQIIERFANVITHSDRVAILDHLGIRKEINNMNSQELIKKLDVIISSWGTHQTFLELVEFGKNSLSKDAPYTLYHKIAGVIELLDLFGFWRDQHTNTSNVARLWDANHGYFGAFCDAFISDDKKARKKIRLAYEIYNIQTPIYDIVGQQEQ